MNYNFTKILSFYKKNGIFNTLKKIIMKIKSKNNVKDNSIYYKITEQKNYKLWIKKNEPSEEELKKQRDYKFEYQPKISIIVPMYKTKEKYLKELVDCIINQTYKNWELCLADGSEEKKAIVQQQVLRDDRIKYIFLNSNNGISENSNAALRMATGDFISLLDHDDLIPQFALFEIVKTINSNKDVDFIYTDEDKILENKDNRIEPHFKPDFALDTLLSYNYICHFSTMKKELIDEIGGFRQEFDGSQDYDLILRAAKIAKKIIHIPKILYHWRISESSVALNSDIKPYTSNAAKKAIKMYLKDIGIKAEVENASIPGNYRVNYIINRKPKVSIIIIYRKEKDLKRCIKTIIDKSTYSNYEILVVNSFNTNDLNKKIEEIDSNKKIKILKYNGKKFNISEMYNYAVKNSNGEYIVLLNNQIQIITDNWMEIMIGNLQRDDVGAVGVKILSKHFKVIHSGIVLGLNDGIGYINKGLSANSLGYMSRNVICQNYSCVSGKMLMISKVDYEKVGGLSEEFSQLYYDVDLCLKIRNQNKVIVMNPDIQAIYYKNKNEKNIGKKEKKRIEYKLKSKWKKNFECKDPYFNPNFREDSSIIRIKKDKIEYDK